MFATKVGCHSSHLSCIVGTGCLYSWFSKETSVNALALRGFTITVIAARNPSLTELNCGGRNYRHCLIQGYQVFQFITALTKSSFLCVGNIRIELSSCLLFILSFGNGVLFSWGLVIYKMTFQFFQLLTSCLGLLTLRIS